MAIPGAGRLDVPSAVGCSGLLAVSRGQAGVGTHRVPMAQQAVSPTGAMCHQHRAWLEHRDSQGWLSSFPSRPGMQLLGLGWTPHSCWQTWPSHRLCGARRWRHRSRLKGNRQLLMLPRLPPSLQGHEVGLTSWHRGQRLYPGRNEEHNVLEGDSRIIYSTKIKGGMQKGIGRFKAAPMAQHHVDVSRSLFHGVNLELGRGTTVFGSSTGGNCLVSSAHGLYNLR